MKLHLPKERTADAWQVYIWNLPDTVLSRPQKLQFMLILESAFNHFDPFMVIADLLKHRDLWEGVIMDRGFLPEGQGVSWMGLATDLIKLRDIGSGHWNVDTLFILIRKDQEGRWRDLGQAWNADAVRVLEGKDVFRLLGASNAEDLFKIVTVWWD